MTDPGPPERPVTVGELVTASIVASVKALKEHESGLREGRDPDHVRKTRVALRRLRSNLRTFGEFLDGDAVGPLVEELAALAARLGGLRDREVLAARLAAGAAQLPPAERLVAEESLARLKEEIEAARAELVGFLDGERWPHLLSRLEALAQRPPLRETAGEPAVQVAGRLAREPFNRLRKLAGRVGRSPADEQLHRVRILTKRSRYAAQAVEAVAGAPAHDFAAAASELQTILGEHQDAVTAEAWLAGQAWEGRAAYVAGRLAGLERAAAVDARGRWRQAWKALAAKPLRAWMDGPPAHPGHHHHEAG